MTDPEPRRHGRDVPDGRPDDAGSERTANDGAQPGFGIIGAVTSLGGVAYVLRCRLTGSDDESE